MINASSVYKQLSHVQMRLRLRRYILGSERDISDSENLAGHVTWTSYGRTVPPGVLDTTEESLNTGGLLSGLNTLLDIGV